MQKNEINTILNIFLIYLYLGQFNINVSIAFIIY